MTRTKKDLPEADELIRMLETPIGRSLLGIADREGSTLTEVAGVIAAFESLSRDVQAEIDRCNRVAQWLEQFIESHGREESARFVRESDAGRAIASDVLRTGLLVNALRHLDFRPSPELRDGAARLEGDLADALQRVVDQMMRAEGLTC